MMFDQLRARVPCALGVVEIPIIICLQTHSEFVEVFSDLMITVEGFVEVCFAVTVQIMESNELIAAGNKYLTITQLYAKRLEEAGSDACPFHRADILFCYAVNSPDISVPGGDNR